MLKKLGQELGWYEIKSSEKLSGFTRFNHVTNQVYFFKDELKFIMKTRFGIKT